MFRSWRVVTVAATAAPLFGDVTAAAVGLALGDGTIPVTVTDTTKYELGDRIVVAPEQLSAGPVPPAGTLIQDTLLVIGIPSATVLTCRSEGDAPTHTHPNGTQIMLSIACAEILVQAVVTNSADSYLGADKTVTNVPGGSVVYDLFKDGSNPFRATHSVQMNAIRTSDLWLVGAAADKVIVGAEIV